MEGKEKIKRGDGRKKEGKNKITHSATIETTTQKD